MNNKYEKKMTLGILLVGVVLLSIGFAAFTASLTVKSTATVTPNSNNFSVVFSKSSTSVDTSDVSVDSTSTTTGTAGKISGTTISNLSANFTAPNQKAIYKFYAYNDGEYTAYLNSITFIGNKTCTATGDVTETLLNEACNSIKMTVQVGNTSTEITKQNITGESIEPKEAALVTVTLEYINGGAYADGNFTVNFSDVSLYYATREGLNEEITSSKPCTLTDSDSDGIADVGEMVSCGEENFYTIENNTTTIAMLAEKNITLADGTNEYPVQSDNAEPIAFSRSNYWWDYTNYTWVEGYEPKEGQEYPFVYDENSKHYPYVEAYEDYLQSIGVNSASASLMSYEQETLISEYSWKHTTNYWLGSVEEEYLVWIVLADGSSSTTDYDGNSTGDGDISGIRPVITISTSELG